MYKSWEGECYESKYKLLVPRWVRVYSPKLPTLSYEKVLEILSDIQALFLYFFKD